MRGFLKHGFAAMLAVCGVSASATDAPPAAAPGPALEFAFEELVTLGGDVHPGQTAMGERNIVPITGGHFEGPGLRGEVMPGGWDWQLIRNDGCLQIKADYFLKTEDGAVINVLNTGVACPPVDGVRQPVFTHPVFEAPKGKYDWLNRATFVGTLVPGGEKDKPAVRIRFYRLR